MEEIPDEVKNFVISGLYETCDLLSDYKKKILRMRIINSHTYLYISQCINKSPPTAKSQFLKCIGIIKRYLQAHQKDVLLKDSFLSIRSQNALISLGIIKISDLNNFPISKLYEIRNMGEQSILEIEGYLCNFGYSLNYDLIDIKIKNQHKINKLLIIKNMDLTIEECKKAIELLLKKINH